MRFSFANKNPGPLVDPGKKTATGRPQQPVAWFSNLAYAPLSTARAVLLAAAAAFEKLTLMRQHL